MFPRRKGRVGCPAMRSLALLGAVPFVLSIAACGSSDKTAPQDPNPGEKQSAGSHYDYGALFEPAPPAEDYTRSVATKIEAIQPGDDITYCQYVMPPLDHDVDILDVTGEQSAGGHHTVAFVTTATEYGVSHSCDEAEQMQSGFLGG